MKTKLLPCPFCGNHYRERIPDENGKYRMNALSIQAELVRGWFDESTMYAVKCNNCGASGGSRTTPEYAVQAWNERGGIDDFDRRYLEEQEAIEKLLAREIGG